MKSGHSKRVRVTARVRVFVRVRLRVRVSVRFRSVVVVVVSVQVRVRVKVMVMTVQFITVQIKTGNHGTAAPTFWPMSIVVKRLDGSRCHLVRQYMSAQTTLC